MPKKSRNDQLTLPPPPRIADRKMASTAVLIDESGQVGRAYGAKTTPRT